MLLLLLINGFAQTQHHADAIPFEPIVIVRGTISDLQWSANSESLLFDWWSPYNPEVQPNWYFVNAEEKILITLSDREVTQMQLQALDIHGEIPRLEQATPTITSGLVFFSPDGRYIAYPTPYLEVDNYTVTLVDTLTEAFVLLTDIRIDGLQTPERYNINWSDDSSAFTVRRVSGFAADDLYYVSNFSRGVLEATVEHIQSFVIDGEVVNVINEPTDLSADGNTLLFWGFSDIMSIALAEVRGGNQIQNRLLHPTDSFVRGLAFSADNLAVLFIDGVGLQQIDLETGQITILDARIHSGWISRAYFSPDGTSIAILGEWDGSTGEQAVYLIDVPSS